MRHLALLRPVGSGVGHLVRDDKVVLDIQPAKKIDKPKAEPATA